MTAREIPADELAEAERMARVVGHEGGELRRIVTLVMAEYDERGRECDAARAEVRGLHRVIAALDVENDAARAELNELRARARRIADNDPRPEAAGAALRILGPTS